MVGFIATAFALKQSLNFYASQTYAPLITAYMRKYESVMKTDMNDITDRKREYYNIDDS